MNGDIEMRGAIELTKVTKSYNGTLALKDVSHSFEPGRVHALMGKNGSGKSTLIEILAGSISPTLGELAVNGEKVAFTGPKDALAAGIVTVHQELSLVPSLSIAENVYLGRLTKKRRLSLPVVDWRALVEQTTALLEDLGIDLDASTLVSRLTVGQQQTIEIIKAIASAPSILLLDEPTSALAAHEVEQLFALIRRLRARGVTIIYITHRMNELFEICDTCTVLRDGAYIGSVELKASSPDQIVEMMFGERSAAPIARRHYQAAEPVLQIRNLSRKNAFSNISFDLHKGEILGIAGLLGSGRTELLRSIFGADPFDEGEIRLGGQLIEMPSPRRMKALGIGYTPEDRKHSALVQMLPVRSNLVLANLPAISSLGVVNKEREKELVATQIAGLSIKVPDDALPVSRLSGGNQQKVVVGNWLNTRPRIIFFDEPTRGIDLRAKEQMFEIIAEQASKGVSCIFVSSELEEVHNIADRILVLKQGQLVADLDPNQLKLAELYRFCMKGNLDD
ncbi:sugar ABC transporter ATP-binding protein [Ochrobactrum soli]|uniref:Sugar ABC transporter ATP-binding protein n=1 Tax=Ochrobactrum soli TaxID=2448455 RepID=A0A849KZR0_9HYPH|nr:sugar ABC transporter ATP-binding protein [[Ochrobactrum] soli]NNU62852.1 sugar ABC transporter ATP-binding protein [[Ochrobactrum] soli]